MQDQQYRTTLTDMDPADEFKDFAYIVSHDLAGPVRSMVGFSQLLKEKLATVESEQDRLHLDLVIESGQKLNDMIQGLLAFSRLNTVARAPVLLELEMIVARCYMMLEPRLDASKGHFNYPRMPEIVADSNEMFTLFYALLDNAIKFRKPDTPPDIRINVDEEASTHWRFTISDNGIGIDPIFYDDVFRPLRKLHTDEAYAGVGMGLTLARKIVRQNGGQMWLETARQGGLAVCFTLPR